MNEEFKPVEVIKSFLGIKKGTVLKFDEFSSKYVSRLREEEIGDEEYYYSGYAIELDPTVIKNNLGKIFKVIEEAKPVVVEEPVVIKPSKKETKLLDAPKEVSEDEIQVPEDAIVVKGEDLVCECGLCHTVTKIATIKYGLFFPVSPNAFLMTRCENCGMTAKIFYDMPNETPEESK